MMPCILLSLILIFSSNLALGEIFRWTDDRGDLHYTDDYTKVPERHRSSIKKIEDGKETEPAKKEGGGPSKGKESPSRDRLGRGEEYWKGRVEELKSKVKALQDKSENLRLRYNELTTKYNDSKSSVERGSLRVERDQIKLEIDQNKAEIEATRIMLEKRIPEEADLFGAKPEWVK
jgi:hypothetical protein